MHTLSPALPFPGGSRAKRNSSSRPSTSTTSRQSSTATSRASSQVQALLHGSVRDRSVLPRGPAPGAPSPGSLFLSLQAFRPLWSFVLQSPRMLTFFGNLHQPPPPATLPFLRNNRAPCGQRILPKQTCSSSPSTESAICGSTRCSSTSATTRPLTRRTTSSWRP